MTLNDFEKELKTLDEKLSIKANPNNPDLASIQYSNQHLLGCPSNNVYDEIKEEYGVATRSGAFIRHRTRLEILNIVKAQLSRINSDKDYRDALLGEGEYA